MFSLLLLLEDLILLMSEIVHLVQNFQCQDLSSHFPLAPNFKFKFVLAIFIPKHSNTVIHIETRGMLKNQACG